MADSDKEMLSPTEGKAASDGDTEREQPVPAEEEGPAARPEGDAAEAGPEVAERASDGQPSAPAPRPGGRGFLPGLLGGVVGAAIGAAAVFYMQPKGAGDATAAEAISALDARVAAVEATVAGLSAVKAEVAGLASRVEGVEAAIDGLDPERIEELSASLAAVANRVAGLEAEMSRVSALARQAAERASSAAEGQGGANAAEATAAAAQVEALVARAEERLRAVEARAAELEAAARDAADRAARRAAIERIGVAVEAGGSFADAAEELRALGVELPPALAEAAEAGVPTLLDLQRRFPEVARQALRAARKAEAGEGLGERALSFLKAEVGLRSVEPKEGTDPDAVLSRAEAAVAEGRLADALAEIEALPEPARAAMSDWERAARQRLEAVAAFRQLSSAG